MYKVGDRRFGHCFAGLRPLELLVQASGNFSGSWRGIRLPSDVEKERASAFILPYNHPKFHGGRS